MSKRLARMKEKPRAGWSINDIEAVCRELGIASDPLRVGGSHYKISDPAMTEILTVPFKRPSNPYISGSS
ncbi:type II toxin-antitoxin system HicA family toxin [Devosia sp. ZB163]|uniref:type II toxin-antitoxin system HicA family toxin n=1 Tax=Devosia sp. ZB163 TaxID=3025938 RepID=UPI0023609F24|nr:type II toxin-antitoxin system HicA family toxin [Devosia sp. ZB163]MDC9822908.1 type II toxin-antitoxin system HicA family toxin [Devosia sp. ZB163]